MTLEDALGRPIVDIEDAVLARHMFGYVKHGTSDDPMQSAIDDINRLTNWEIVQVISLAADLANAEARVKEGDEEIFRIREVVSSVIDHLEKNPMYTSKAVRWLHGALNQPKESDREG